MRSGTRTLAFVALASLWCDVVRAHDPGGGAALIALVVVLPLLAVPIALFLVAMSSAHLGPDMAGIGFARRWFIRSQSVVLLVGWCVVAFIVAWTHEVGGVVALAPLLAAIPGSVAWWFVARGPALSSECSQVDRAVLVDAMNRRLSEGHEHFMARSPSFSSVREFWSVLVGGGLIFVVMAGAIGAARSVFVALAAMSALAAFHRTLRFRLIGLRGTVLDVRRSWDGAASLAIGDVVGWCRTGRHERLLVRVGRRVCEVPVQIGYGAAGDRDWNLCFEESPVHA